MEAAGLSVVVIMAGLFAVLLEYPDSPVHQVIPDAFLRRTLFGMLVGLAVALFIYSPWGQQSGAHMNPALTLTFWALGKVATWDAVFYIVAQFLGGLVGILAVLAALGDRFARPPISYIATVPGVAGTLIALVAEAALAFVLMLAVLYSANTQKLSRFTGLIVGLLFFVYIALESPISGASLNPARTFASVLPSGIWTAFWIYLTGPIMGMGLAAAFYVTINGRSAVTCAKLNHHTTRRCIFRHGQHTEHQASSSRVNN
jgi:aquaporin Z